MAEATSATDEVVAEAASTADEVTAEAASTTAEVTAEAVEVHKRGHLCLETGINILLAEFIGENTFSSDLTIL